MEGTEINDMVTSPYRRGADDGFVFGIYLTLLFFGSIFSQRVPLLGLLSGLLAVCVPLVIFLFMRRYDRQLLGHTTFAMLWMQGVMIFVCGMLISGALLVVYMKWLNPDFIRMQIEAIAELGESAAAQGTTLAEMGSVARQMLNANFVPTAIGVVAEMIMLAIVTGSLLSILLSCYFAFKHKMVRKNL